MRIPLKAAISLLAIVLLAACTGTPSGTVPHETATHTVSTATQSAPTAPVATGATLAAVSTRKPALGCASGDVTLKVYFDPVAQYCLLYPARFTVGDVQPGYHVAFYGPPTADSPGGALSLMEPGLALGRTVTQVVDEFLKSAGQSSPPIVREATTIGGEPAEMVKNVFGEAGLVWEVFVVHADHIYRFTLYPMEDVLVATRPDIDAIWQAVQRSFTFLEAAPPRAAPIEATPAR
ncbi:hypothetical protein [Candidatus Amarolinea aalborgensis]|uniref:hypothetical protein n=1 Tax=Candidatus Amarolinea aalborgensis TaxID=2249329 RepID=UPI003BF97681